MSAKIAAPAFVAAALYPGVLAAFVEGDRLFALLRGDAVRLRSEGARALFSRRPGETAFAAAPTGEPIPGEEWVAVVSRPLY